MRRRCEEKASRSRVADSVIDAGGKPEKVLFCNLIGEFMCVKQNAYGMEAHYTFDILGRVKSVVEEINANRNASGATKADKEQSKCVKWHFVRLRVSRAQCLCRHMNRSGRTAFQLKIADAVVNGFIGLLKAFNLGSKLCRSLEFWCGRCCTLHILLQFLRYLGCTK